MSGINGFLRELMLQGGNLEGMLLNEGRLFQYGDTDFNDLVTAQTSFDETTPTFSVDVASGSVAIVLEATFSQTGSVAGDTINVIAGVDNAAGRASGGTAETPFSLRTDSPQGSVSATGAAGSANAGIVVYSNPTKAAGFGQRLFGPQPFGQDVAPAEGHSNEIIVPTGPALLVGPACYVVYFYAGTTAPTLGWSMRIGKIPLNWLGV